MRFILPELQKVRKIRHPDPKVCLWALICPYCDRPQKWRGEETWEYPHFCKMVRKRCDSCGNVMRMK